MMAWIKTFPYHTRVSADFNHRVIPHLEGQGFKTFAVVGFCWGVWVAERHAVDAPERVACVVGAHPSTRLEGAFEGGDELALANAVRCPIFLMPAGNDPDNNKPGGANIVAMIANLGADKVGCVEFADMRHGWANRGDVEADPAVARSVEKFMELTLDWLAKFA
mmetsp:Transcript_8051/g.20341  ORF Transcript_8051/g.20341 Transcript_8051/m.20341 type:complete len:164 (+) Transcript_8051:396-887(+)